jgi:hypothetical protein
MALTKEVREYFAKEGRRGGKKAAANMTAKERTERMRRAANARWSKEKKATPK